MKIYLIAIALLASLMCNAQQDPQYSQYMFNLVNVNPGYVGSRNVLSVVGIHRNQWMNVEGAPRTSSLTADMPVAQNKVGLGVSFVNDNIGRFNNNVVNFYASYRLKIDRKGTLGMGLSAGVNMLRGDLSSIRSNPQWTSEALFQDYSKTSPAFGVGFFYSRDNWYLGLSAPNLLTSYQSVYSSENNVIRKFQHWFFMGGYVFHFSNLVQLKPSFMVKGATGAPMAIDLNATVWLHNVIGIGASYRINNAMVALLEVQASRQLRFGYALDYTTSDFRNKNGKPPLTHEFLLRYEFGNQKKNVLSPRYF